MDKMEFKDIFKYLRLREGLSQSQIAKKLGVSPALIGMYEQGRRYPSYEMIENIADFFNVSTGFLNGVDVEVRDDKEAQLIKAYRQLDSMNKLHLLAYLKFLEKASANNDNDNNKENKIVDMDIATDKIDLSDLYGGYDGNEIYIQ